MKTQNITVKYGVADGLIGNRYGIKIDGCRCGYRTFKTRETAQIKALEFARSVRQNHYDSFYDTQFNFTFQLEQ